MAKVLIYSPNLIGKSMAGAAIRSWEFAKVLAQEHQVILISPGRVEIKASEFTIISIQDSECKKHFRDAHVLVTQRLTFPLALMAKLHRVRIVIDAYDPSPLELLEHFKTQPLKERHQQVISEISTLLFSFKIADGILCASEKQRELWLGFLLAQKLITPALYDQDSSLRHFIDIVPFGLSPIPPQKNGPGLREKYGLRSSDQVILWGGGIWNWFDPLSLIKALKIISQTRTDIKLVFMGIKPPDPALPATSMSAAAIQLAKELGILDTFVFFNHEWVPYEQRQNFLLDANIGVSTHFDHLETHFSFRTRILDYLWTQLPILATQGDAFAELIEREQLGKVVPYQNTQAIVAAIFELVDHPDRIQQMKGNLARVRQQFYWPAVVHPLNQMIKQLKGGTSSRSQWQEGKTLLKFVGTKLKEKGITSCLNKIYRYCYKKSSL